MFDFNLLGNAFKNTLGDIIDSVVADGVEDIVNEAESLVTEETNN